MFKFHLNANQSSPQTESHSKFGNVAKLALPLRVRKVGNVSQVTFAQTPEVVRPGSAFTVEPCPVTSDWSPGFSSPQVRTRSSLGVSFKNLLSAGCRCGSVYFPCYHGNRRWRTAIAGGALLSFFFRRRQNSNKN